MLIELNAININNPALWVFGNGSTIEGLDINNDHGNTIQLDGNGNLVIGDFIGTDTSGTVALGQTEAGVVVNGMNNTIGGISAAERNVISGNYLGVGLQGSAVDNQVLGNYIGTDATGTMPLGNTTGGVSVFNGATGNTVGGTAPGAGNVISGNTGVGVGFAAPGTSGNYVLGNLIGVNATDTLALPNTNGGVFIGQGASSTMVGGNVISGNDGIGVRIVDVGTSNNLVEGNDIGTDATGNIAIPNTADGVSIGGADTTGNQIGGTTPGAGNIIAFNHGAGVSVFDSGLPGATGNPILGNSIYDNDGLGIDLGDTGTPLLNDSQGNVGPNNFQEFPVLVAAQSGSFTTVLGTFNSAPSTTYTLDFNGNAAADPSGYGQGQYYLGANTVTTDTYGNASFLITLPAATTDGEVISATATDPNGNTSEFSEDITAEAASGSQSGMSVLLSGGSNSGSVQVGARRHCPTNARSLRDRRHRNTSGRGQQRRTGHLHRELRQHSDHADLDHRRRYEQW